MEHGGVEIRRFGHNNSLIEERSPSVEVYIVNMTLQDYSALKQKVVELEAEVESLKKTMPPNRKKRSRKVQPTKEV
jgi:hypothetical protein